MNRRPFGKTGITVSEIGLGAWQLANPDWGLTDKDEAIKIVHTALDLGCNFFDTAPGYGNGRSEELLGQALKGKRQQIVYCSKYTNYTDGVRNFDASGIRPVLESSLRRLGTDFIDLYILHNPPRELMDGRNAPDIYEELERVKQEGKIREYGISLDWRVELETMMDTTRSKAAEVFFNALYQEPLPAFKRAEQEGVGLIIKVPLDSGWLSGKYRGNSRFDDVRKRWSPEVIARRADLVEKFAALVPSGMSLTHAALQYCLAQPGVSSVIPGPKSVAQTHDNFAAAEKPLPPEAVSAMHDLWLREIAHDPLPW